MADLIEALKTAQKENDIFRAALQKIVNVDSPPKAAWFMRNTAKAALAQASSGDVETQRKPEVRISAAQIERLFRAKDPLS